MRYVALFTGEGEGCDYTIGCNKSFEVFEAVSDEDAIQCCRDIWEDHGDHCGDKDYNSGASRIAHIQLFKGCETVSISAETWNEEAEKEKTNRLVEQELIKAEARVAELKARKTR